MDKSTRDEIVTQQLQTPRGKELFAAAFFRGVNRAFKIPDTEGDSVIQEFQERYGTSGGLLTYLLHLRDTTNRTKPTTH
jgi:hypothetical protein